MSHTSTPAAPAGRSPGRRPTSSSSAARRRPWTCAALALAAALGACGRDASPVAEPSLVLVDSLVLQEDDSTYVAEPFDLVASPDGGFLISDVFTKRVLRYRRDGAFAGSIGREGKGPREFVNPTWLALAGDSLLYVVNDARIDTYHLANAEFGTSRRLQRKAFMLAAQGDEVFAGHPDSLHNTAVSHGNLRAGLRGTAPLLFPMNRPGMYHMFGHVAVAVHGDTLATAYAVTDRIYLTDRRTGAVVDSIAVPVVRRQGANSERIARYVKTPANQELAIQAVNGASLPMDLHWLPSGALAVVSEDWTVDAKGHFSGTKFLSVVDPRSRAGCADAVVPGPIQPPTTVGFRGDTLFVLSQSVDANDPATVIRAYRIDLNACGFARAPTGADDDEKEAGLAGGVGGRPVDGGGAERGATRGRGGSGPRHRGRAPARRAARARPAAGGPSQRRAGVLHPLRLFVRGHPEPVE
jgi:hypothetical protein